MPYPWLDNISGNEKIYVWIFLIGMLLWWAYSEGFFSSIINKSKEFDDRGKSNYENKK